MNNSILKKLIMLIAMISLVGCADPAFNRYVEERHAAIAAMPDGPMKYEAEQQLALQIFQENRRKEAQANQAAMGIAAGMAAGAAAAAEANRAYYRQPTVVIYNGY